MAKVVSRILFDILTADVETANEIEERIRAKYKAEGETNPDVIRAALFGAMRCEYERLRDKYGKAIGLVVYESESDEDKRKREHDAEVRAAETTRAKNKAIEDKYRDKYSGSW